MHISLIQALLCGIVYFLGFDGCPIVGVTISQAFKRPIVCGTLVGLILGDPVTGCIMGAAINLPYLVVISAGGSVPLDPGLAGTLGTALGMASNVSPSVAVTLATPFALLGTLLWVVHMTVDVAFVHLCDKAAAEGDLKKVCFYHFVPPTIFMFLITVIPVFVTLYYGGNAISGFISSLSGTPLTILSLIGGVLPALGIALNLRAMTSKDTLVFFMLGFLIVGYSNLPILGLSLFAVIISYIYTKFIVKDEVNED